MVESYLVAKKATDRLTVLKNKHILRECFTVSTISLLLKSIYLKSVLNKKSYYYRQTVGITFRTNTIILTAGNRSNETLAKMKPFSMAFVNLYCLVMRIPNA